MRNSSFLFHHVIIIFVALALVFLPPAAGFGMFKGVQVSQLTQQQRHRRFYTAPMFLASTNDTPQVVPISAFPANATRFTADIPQVPAVVTAAEGDVFSVAYDMMCLSTFVYKYADLVRGDKQLKTVLKPPMTLCQVMETVLNHVDQVFDLCETKDDAKWFLHSLQTLQKEHANSEWMDFQDGGKASCVYGILLNHDTKRCIVVFRGTKDANDFIQDSKVPLQRKDNPVLELRSHFGDVFVHQGFDEILFQTRHNKANEILQQLYPYANEGYSLLLTGHSLGGALATLVGFYAAADHRSLYTGEGRPPVQVYSFGSPRVGDKLFADAFLYLESQHKMRHARFYNRMDLVARAPTHAPPRFKRYAHVGMGVSLRSDMLPTFKYAPTIQEEDENLRDIVRSEAFRTRFGPLSLIQGGPSAAMLGKAIHHDAGTYLKRLDTAKRETAKTSLEEAYQKSKSAKAKSPR